MGQFTMLIGRLIVGLMLLGGAVVLADDPSCWVCQVKPPAAGDKPAPEAKHPPTRPKEQHEDTAPQDDRPDPFSDMSECGPNEQFILNCDHLET